MQLPGYYFRNLIHGRSRCGVNFSNWKNDKLVWFLLFCLISHTELQLFGICICTYVLNNYGLFLDRMDWWWVLWRDCLECSLLLWFVCSILHFTDKRTEEVFWTVWHQCERIASYSSTWLLKWWNHNNVN